MHILRFYFGKLTNLCGVDTAFFIFENPTFYGAFFGKWTLSYVRTSSHDKISKKLNLIKTVDTAFLLWGADLHHILIMLSIRLVLDRCSHTLCGNTIV